MENIGWFIILILPQAMKMAPLKLVWRGQKTKSCWTGTFRISLASPGKSGADWEAGGLYKACIIRNNDIWYMFYNAKDKEEERWTEQTGVCNLKGSSSLGKI